MDIPLEQKKGLKKKHIPYLLGGAVLIFIVWLIFSDHSSSLVIDSRTITTGTARKALFNDYIQVQGSVQPITTLQLTPLESGMVEKRLIEEGSSVKEGDIIVMLSNQNLNAEVLNSESQLSNRENDLHNARIAMEQERLNLQKEQLTLNLDIQRKKRVFQQKKKLYEEKLVAREEYLQAQEDYDLAEQSRDIMLERQTQDSLARALQIAHLEDAVENMRKNMNLILQRVENLKVKSPIDGELVRLGVELGQSVSSGTMIGQINDLSDFKIQAMIDEHYIDKVHTGLEAKFERQEKEFGLRVNKVYPEVQNGQFKTDLHFSGERPENIRPGQTYYIDLELGQPTESILIPRGAFYQSTGGSWIFVLSPDGTKAFRRTIKIGRQNPQYYEVLEGLDPNERVIVSSYETYGDNEVLILK